MHNGVAKTEGRTTREQQAADQAAELILFADGVEDAGHPELARRSRNVARETIWLVDSLEAERSARRAMQEAHDRCVALLTTRCDNGRCVRDEAGE